MSKAKWNTNQIQDLSGKVVVITGSTSGLGKEAARVMAKKNATVVMAIRNVGKGEQVAAEIRKESPSANIEIRQLDLSSLKSTQAFAEDFLAAHDRLDVLINNAGIMLCPYSKTDEGFEMQMGTNHFGHFALVGHLMPVLKSTKDSRIVVTSSVGHRFGEIDFADINWESRKYNAQKAYGDSKLANLYFTYELARRLKDDPEAPTVTASHPGWTATELQRHAGFLQILNHVFAQKVESGVLPTLRAAFDPDAQSGDYYGPGVFFEMWGHPVKVESNPLSHDVSAQQKLWSLSEEATQVCY